MIRASHREADDDPEPDVDDEPPFGAPEPVHAEFANPSKMKQCGGLVCRQRCRPEMKRWIARSISIISRSNVPELSKKIIQKGLAFARDWSGTVAHSGSKDAQRSCPAGF